MNFKGQLKSEVSNMFMLIFYKWFPSLFIPAANMENLTNSDMPGSSLLPKRKGGRLLGELIL